ncbi:MAG TPA: Gldg family protein, partial [Myxococcota bacterium]|nr:Gldg family protein [Myxococcota bacterium]
GAFAERERLPTLLKVAWPGLVLLGLLPTIAMELAVGSMQHTPTLEIWRVRLASRAARIMAFALVAFAGINYTAATWNHKIDLSYFKTTKLGSATRNIASNLTQPVKVYLFFPPGNDVLELARAYFDELAHASDQVEVKVLDQALEPDKAKDMKVRANGWVAIQSGNNTETLRLDLDAEEARGALRSLDAEVQQRLLKVIRPGRIAYFTTGHMERDYAPPVDDRRPGLADFKMLLEAQGFSIRRLGLGEGLGTDIPKDATLVCVMGPTDAFTPTERGALHRYLEAGGRALIALDPDHGVVEDELLAPLGLQLDRTLVANDRFLVRVEGQSESPYNMVTTRTSAHPTVTTMEQNPGRLGLVFLGAGSLRKREPSPAGVTVFFPVHAMA